MVRNVNLDEITDGRLYGLNDLVKADCGGCEGCSSCCHGMGNTIVLDPFDIYRLVINSNKTFEELLVDKIELNLVDGIILPNLKMSGPSEKCAFLNNEGRCSIHGYRPGICRIFPLGRYYEDHSFKYILQVHECSKENKVKVKVRKWIDIDDIKQNEQFIIDWHYFLKDVQNMIKNSKEDAQIKQINMYMLNRFYMTAFTESSDFYTQFNERLALAKEVIIKGSPF